MIFILAFLAFAVLHSILAARQVKRAIITRIPFLRHTYRLLYNLVALFTLAAVWFWAPVDSHTMYHLSPPFSYLFHLIQLGALAGLVYSVQTAGTGYFSGLQQLRDSRMEPAPTYDLDEPASAELVVSGPFRMIRHPLYLFSIILLLAHPYMSLKWMLFTGSAILYFWIGSRIEEQKLILRFGDAYRKYIREVPAFIPHWKTVFR